MQVVGGRMLLFACCWQACRNSESACSFATVFLWLLLCLWRPRDWGSLGTRARQFGSRGRSSRPHPSQHFASPKHWPLHVARGCPPRALGERRRGRCLRAPSASAACCAWPHCAHRASSGGWAVDVQKRGSDGAIGVRRMLPTYVSVTIASARMAISDRAATPGRSIVGLGLCVLCCGHCGPTGLTCKFAGFCMRGPCQDTTCCAGCRLPLQHPVDVNL